MAVIELQNLSVAYGHRTVLSDLTLRFPEGEVTVLLGPNGCGKSTLLRAAMGLIPRGSGTIRIDGDSIDRLSPREIARRAAYLSQNRNVPSITAGRMVLHGRFPYLSYPRHYRREDYEAVEQAMARTDCLDLMDRALPTLSGGQRQKVYLAMALAQDTGTILMDEPTTFLDVRHQLEVMAVARDLAREGRAVVLVLHDFGLALRGADRIAVLSGGTAVRVGTPDEIFSDGVLDRVFSVQTRRVNTENGWQYYCCGLGEED